MNSILDDCQSPEFRTRSQTWGGNDNNYRSRIMESDLTPQYTYDDSYISINNSALEDQTNESKQDLQPKLLTSKKSSRKNPWGQETYSDLIEAAINSHPNRMATLQQIYEHISKNNKYFAERADPTSSAGWKNSIRHNLSLHDKFVKCPKKNENMKSSLWSINTKSYKRERSNSMDCKRPTFDVTGKRKLLKEQRRHVSSNINTQSTAKISPYSERLVSTSREENTLTSVSPQNQSSFMYESNESDMNSISDFNYNEHKLKYLSPMPSNKTSTDIEFDSGYSKFPIDEQNSLHEDLQRLNVDSMKNFHNKNSDSLNLNHGYCPNFQVAAMEYSRFIADIFIDDVE